MCGFCLIKCLRFTSHFSFSFNAKDVANVDDDDEQDEAEYKNVFN